MAGRLAGKNAIITGGAAGIGLATATLFGCEGARVAIVDRDRTRSREAEKQLQHKGIDATSWCLDVADECSVGEAFGEIIDGYAGAVHALVNNAGIAEFAGVTEATLDGFQRIMAVNVIGTFLCSKAALPALLRNGGAIVNVASIAGLIGIPRMAAYCTSKAAVIGLTRQMAVDYSGLGVRINCVCPGRVADTELDRWIREQDSDEATQTKMAHYPIGRFGRPQEIAEAVLFLACHETGFISGTALTVDGGMTAR